MEAFADFTCGDDDLDDFIRSDALRLHTLNVARTYVAHYRGHACGYVASMTDAIVLKPNERKKIRDAGGRGLAFDDHPVVPPLKIARLAVGKSAVATGVHSPAAERAQARPLALSSTGSERPSDGPQMVGAAGFEPATPRPPV